MFEPIEEELRLVNWNVGGAKYLAYRSQTDIEDKPDLARDTREGPREVFRKDLNLAMSQIIKMHGNPHVIMMQELTEYHPAGDYDNCQHIIDEPPGYEIFRTRLVDTRRQSHQGKWNKVRGRGGWEEHAYFGQGNGVLVRKELAERMFPVMALPASGVSYREWAEAVSPIGPVVDLASRRRPEHIRLETGMYFGNRDTEARVASVFHFCVDGCDGRPLDIFLINTHLTTLTTEREGVPSVDKNASQTRIGQLDIVFDRIISRYNLWRKDRYRVRGERIERKPEESEERMSPVWILGGDLNFTPESEEYRYIIGRNFEDLRKDHEGFTKASGPKQDPTHTLDYVFVGPLFESIDPLALKLTPRKREVIDNKWTRVSDHFPIYVTMPSDIVKTPPPDTPM